MMVYSFTTSRSVGLLTMKLLHILIMLALDSARAGQQRSMWWRLPTWSEQPGSLQRPSGLSLTQCLERRLVLYRPDIILAVITAFLTSNGLPAYNQCGWGCERDMKLGLKYSKEGSISASALSFFSKKLMTEDLHLLFHCPFVGGNWRIVRGSGRSYFAEIILTVKNQEDLGAEDSVAERRTCLPCWWRMWLGPSLAIIPREQSIRRWRIPVAGRLPARNRTTGSGVLGRVAGVAQG